MAQLAICFGNVVWQADALYAVPDLVSNFGFEFSAFGLKQTKFDRVFDNEWLTYKKFHNSFLGVWSPIRIGMSKFGKCEIDKLRTTLERFGVNLLTLTTDRRSRRDQMKLEFTESATGDVRVNLIKMMTCGVGASGFQLIPAVRADD
jgi:hypothetical protein